MKENKNTKDTIKTTKQTKKYIVDPEDLLSYIEQASCEQDEKELSCKNHEKFSVKNFMLKGSR